jgi:hypothetical protein
VAFDFLQDVPEGSAPSQQPAADERYVQPGAASEPPPARAERPGRAEPPAEMGEGRADWVERQPLTPPPPAPAQAPTELEEGPESAGYLPAALAAFNASEYPRRVAGVARSLGAPEVSVRSAEHLSSVVRIVVAWELCWYRYEVDLSDGPAETRVLEQGTELSELAREDRLANALAAEDGTLHLQ